MFLLHFTIIITFLVSLHSKQCKNHLPTSHCTQHNATKKKIFASLSQSYTVGIIYCFNKQNATFNLTHTRLQIQQPTYYLQIWNDIFNNFFKDRHPKQVIFNVNIHNDINGPKRKCASCNIIFVQPYTVFAFDTTKAVVSPFDSGINIALG